SERKDIYDRYLTELLDKGLAYYAFDTSEEIEAEHEAQVANGETPRYIGKWRDKSQEEIDAARAEGRPETIRFRVPDNTTYTLYDRVRCEISIVSSAISGDFFISKQDGMRTYNFAVGVDDHLMEITHVLRCDDHNANTPKQLMIYDALGFERPTFGQMTLIAN